MSQVSRVKKTQAQASRVETEMLIFKGTLRPKFELLMWNEKILQCICKTIP